MTKDTKSRILIVDDDPDIRLLVVGILQKDYIVDTAENGKRGLEKVAEFLPDLILMDLEMPEVTGWEACERLKNDPRTNEIPIIVLTAKSGINDLRKSFDCGAVDYLIKGATMEELKLRVRNTLLMKEKNEQIREWKVRMDNELTLAGALQESILSTKPEYTDAFDVYWSHRPSIEIGGDVFGTVRCVTGRTCIYVADVSGHGVAPALLSCMIMALMSELLHTHHESPPSEICNKLESRFRTYVKNSELFVTLFLMIHDPPEDHWKCISCGHHGPLVYKDHQRIMLDELAGIGGFPIGMNFIPGSEFGHKDELTIPVAPGMTVVLFTDGVIEACDGKSGKQCGTDGVDTIIRGLLKEEPIHNLASRILPKMEFLGFCTDKDDCSIAIIDVIGIETTAISETVSPELKQMKDLASASREALTAAKWPQAASSAVEAFIVEYASNILVDGNIDEDENIKLTLRIYENYCLVLITYPGSSWAFEESLRQLYENSTESGIYSDENLTRISLIVDQVHLHRYGGRHWGIFQVNKKSNFTSL